MSIVIDVETRDEGSKSKLAGLNKQLADLFKGSKKAQGGLDSIGGMKPQTAQNVRQTNAALKDMAKTDLSKVNKDLGQLSRVAGNAQTAVVGLGVAFAGFAAVKGLQQTIDGFTNLQNSLKIVSDSLGEVERRTDRAFSIAANARSGIGATVGVFSDFARALEQLNVSDSKLFRATNVIQKGVALSPGSRESAESAIFQLRQGLSAGVLRGQELNSVLEQLPFIGQGIAKSLSLSVGELRNFAEQGKLTSQVVLQALLDLEKNADATFAKTAFRLSDSLKFLSETISISAGNVLSAFPTKASDNLVSFSKRLFEFAGTLRAVIPIAREQYAAFIAGLRDTSFSQSLKGFSDGTKSLLSPFREISREQQLERVVEFFDRLSNRLSNFSLGSISTTLLDIPRLFTELQRSLLTVSATLFGIFDGIRLNAPRILFPVRSFFSSAAIEAKVGSVRLAAAATQGSRDLRSAIGSLFENATGGGFSDRRAVFDFMAIFKAGSLAEFNNALLDFSRNFRTFDKSLTKRITLSLTNTANGLSAQVQRILQFSGILDPRFLFANNFSSNAFVSFISAVYKQFFEVPLLRFLAILRIRLKAAVDLFVPALANIFDENTGQKFGTLLADTIKFVVNGITSAITGSSGPFSELAVAVINGLKLSFIALLKFLRGAIAGFIDTLTGGSQVGDFFDRVFGKTTLLNSALDNIKKFGQSVKDIFYDVYDAVVGNSYWPDTIDEVVAYAREVTGAAGPIEKMLNRVRSAFKDVWEFVKKNIQGTRVGDFVISVAADIEAIDFGKIFRNLASQFSAILIAAVSIAYGGLGAKLLGIFSIASLINTSADGALSNISRFVGTELGFAAQQFGENLIDGIVLAIKALIVAAPAFIDGLLSGFGPAGEVAKFLSQFVFGFTNTVFQAALVLSAGLAIFSDTFRKTASTFLLGGKAKKGAKEKGVEAVEGVADGLLPGFLSFLGVGTAAVNTSIIKQKQFGILALASFAATATGFLDIFQGITTTLPLLGIALLGPDGGRVLLIKLTKVLRGVFVSAVTQITALTGGQDFFVGIAKQLVGIKKTATVQGQKFGFAFSKAAEGDIANVFSILSAIPGNFAKGQAQFISDKNFGFAELFFGPKGAEGAINAIDDAQGELFSRLATTGPKEQGELFDFSEAPVKLPKGGLEGLKESLASLKEQAKSAIGTALTNSRAEFKKLGPAFSSAFEAISRNSRRAFSAIATGFSAVVERAKVAGAAIGRFGLLLKVGLVGGLLLAASAASASEGGLNGMVNSLIAADAATLALGGSLAVLGLAAFSTTVLNVLSNVTRMTTALRESRVAILATEGLSAVAGSRFGGALAGGFTKAISAATGYLSKLRLINAASTAGAAAGGIKGFAQKGLGKIFEFAPSVASAATKGIGNIFTLFGKIVKLPIVARAGVFGLIGTVLFGLFGPGSGFANNIAGLFDKVLGFLGIVEKTGAGKIAALNKFASRQAGLNGKDGKPVDELQFNISNAIAQLDIGKIPEQQFVVIKDALSKGFDEIAEIQNRSLLNGFTSKADANRLAEVTTDLERLLRRFPQRVAEGIPAQSKQLKEDQLGRRLSLGSIIRTLLPNNAIPAATELATVVVTPIRGFFSLIGKAFTFLSDNFGKILSVVGSTITALTLGGPFAAIATLIGSTLFFVFEDGINAFFKQLGGIKDSIAQGLFILFSDPPSDLAKTEAGTLDSISTLEKYYSFLDKADQDRFLKSRENYTKDLRALDDLTRNGFQGQFGGITEYNRQVGLLTAQFNRSKSELVAINKELGQQSLNRKLTNDLTEGLKPLSSSVSANLGVDFGPSFEKLFTGSGTLKILDDGVKTVDKIRKRLKETFDFAQRQELFRDLNAEEAAAKAIETINDAFKQANLTITYTAKLLNESEVASSFERAINTKPPSFRRAFANAARDVETAQSRVNTASIFGTSEEYAAAVAKLKEAKTVLDSYKFPTVALEDFNARLGALKVPTLDDITFSGASIDNIAILNSELDKGDELAAAYQASLKLVGSDLSGIKAAQAALEALNKQRANIRSATLQTQVDAATTKTPQKFIADQIVEGVNVPDAALSAGGAKAFQKLTANALRAQAALNDATNQGKEIAQPLIDSYARAQKALSEFGQAPEKAQGFVNNLAALAEVGIEATLGDFSRSVSKNRNRVFAALDELHAIDETINQASASTALRLAARREDLLDELAGLGDIADLSSLTLAKLVDQEGLSVLNSDTKTITTISRFINDVALAEAALTRARGPDDYRKKLQKLADAQSQLDEAVANSPQTFETAFARINEVFGVNLTPVDLAASIDISEIAAKANVIAAELRKAVRDGVTPDSDTFRGLQKSLKDALLRGEIVSAITTLGRNLELALTDGATKSFKRMAELSREIDPGAIAFGRRGRNDQTESRAGLESGAAIIDLLENTRLNEGQNDVITEFLKSGGGNADDLNALLGSFKSPLAENTDAIRKNTSAITGQPVEGEIVVTASNAKANTQGNLETALLQQADRIFENFTKNVNAANSPLNAAKLANPNIDPALLNFATPESLKKFTDIGLRIAELDKILAQSVITGEDITGVAEARQRYLNNITLLTDGIVNVAERAFNAGQQFAADVNQALNSNIKDIFKSGKSLKDAFNGLLSSIANGILDASIDRITDLITGKGGLLDSLFSSIGSTVYGGSQGGGMLGGLFGGKQGNTPKVASAVGSVFSSEASGIDGGSILGGINGIFGSVIGLFGGNKKEESPFTASIDPLTDTNQSLNKTFGKGTDILGEGLNFASENIADLTNEIPKILSGGGGGASLSGSGAVDQLLAQGLGFLIGSLFADGGPITGPGTGRSDNILIGASNGEYMINAASTRKHRKLIEAINKDNLATFLDGQVVPPSTVELPVPVPSAGLGGGIVRGGDTYNLQITGDVSRQTRKEIITMLPTIATGVNGFNKEKGIA